MEQRYLLHHWLYSNFRKETYQSNWLYRARVYHLRQANTAFRLVHGENIIAYSNAHGLTAGDPALLEMVRGLDV